MTKKDEKPKVLDYKKTIEITPIRDYKLHCPPHFSGELTEGKAVEIPEFLKQSLIVEGVIKVR